MNVGAKNFGSPSGEPKHHNQTNTQKKCEKLLTLPSNAQFAHTDHKQIVDPIAKLLLSRAMNLGNWLLHTSSSDQEDEGRLLLPLKDKMRYVYEIPPFPNARAMRSPMGSLSFSSNHIQV
jgi:hypothetical protein